MMKLYFKMGFTATAVLLLVGFIAPYLFSAANTALVALGAALIFFAIPALYCIIKNIRSDWKKVFSKGGSLLFVLCIFISLTACSKVPAGNVGVKVYLLGGDKGVDSEELGVGRYYIGINEELYLFPTFTKNYVWTADKQESSPNDESITFQTAEGMSVNADVGISYHIDAKMVNTIFQKYRKGVDEITDIYLRNMVRDAFNQVGSQNKVESVYGTGKTKLINDVEKIVRDQVEPIGIVIEKIYLAGSMRLPEAVITALNRKIEATQRAEQRENELREAEAEAKKKVAEATGDAEALLTKAEAQAKANKILAASITSSLIRYEAMKQWDGVMPKLIGGNSMLPMVNLDTK